MRVIETVTTCDTKWNEYSTYVYWTEHHLDS